MALPTRIPIPADISPRTHRKFNLVRLGAALVTIAVPAILLPLIPVDSTAQGVFRWLLPLLLVSILGVIYGLAYFHYLPEIAGGASSSPLPLTVRWMHWLRTSGLFLFFVGVALTIVDKLAHHLPWANVLLILGYGIPLGYAIATVFFVLNRFAAPEPWPEHYSPQTSRFRKMVDHCAWPARWLARRLKPRFCASWGSLAVLLSLVFMTSENFGCSSSRTPGYEVLTVQETWITALNFRHETFSFFADPAGKVFYSLAILVAAIVLVRYSRRPVDPRERRLLSSLVDIIGWSTLFFLTDLSLFAWLVTPLWIVYGALPIALWLWFHRAPKWPLVRSFLVVLYLPTIAASYLVLTIPVSEYLVGYVLLFFGSQLLWLGLAQIAREGRFAP